MFFCASPMKCYVSFITITSYERELPKPQEAHSVFLMNDKFFQKTSTFFIILIYISLYLCFLQYQIGPTRTGPFIAPTRICSSKRTRCIWSNQCNINLSCYKHIFYVISPRLVMPFELISLDLLT